MVEIAAPTTVATPTGASATSVHQTGAATIDRPLPATAPGVPKYGQGSATTLRAEYDKLQKQLDDINKRIADRDASAGPDEPTGPRPTETTTINALNTRLAALTTAISAQESKAPTLIAGGSPADHYNIFENPDGTIRTELNANWDQKSEKAQVVTAGNRIFTIDPRTGEATVAYTDKDAQALAERQTAVAEANQRVAAARAAAEEKRDNARIELEERVSRGEDAASVRAEQAQEITALHQEWVRTDGDARRVHEEWRDYQTERHNTAAEELSRDQLEQTKEWQRQQTETAEKGLEQRQKEAAITARTSLANARLGAGQGYTGNVLSTLAQLNKDVAPGSSAVGEMLAPLLALGQQFFGQLGGLPDPEQVVAGNAAAASGQPAAAAANPVLPGTAVPGVPAPAAAAQAASAPLAPDGSPYVTPDYVAQKLAERRNPQQAAEGNTAPLQRGPLSG